MNNNHLENCKSLEELFGLWKNKPSDIGINHQDDVFIADGIVDPETWNSGNKKKILFVLKEAYGRDWNRHTLATWLHTCPKRRIWDRVARVTYGIQNTTAFEISRYKPELNDSENKEAHDQIAVMNLKKSGGKSYSDYDEIRKYAEYDREELKKEFELIDAEVIICGSTFKILYEVVFGNEPMSCEDKCDNWYYWFSFKGKNRLFIDYYHPSIHDSDLLYYYGLIGIYQQALLNEPCLLETSLMK